MLRAKTKYIDPVKQISHQGFQLLYGKEKPIATTETKISRTFYCDVFQFYPANALSEGTRRTKNTWKIRSAYVGIVVARGLRT